MFHGCYHVLQYCTAILQFIAKDGHASEAANLVLVPKGRRCKAVPPPVQGADLASEGHAIAAHVFASGFLPAVAPGDWQRAAMSRAPAANPQRRAAGALFLLLAAGLLLGGGVLLEWIGLPPAVLSMGGAGRCPATVCACRTAPQLPPPSSPPPDDHSLHVEAASQWEDEALLSPQLDEAAERDSQRRRGKQRQGKQQRDGGAKPSSPSKGSTKKQASLQQHERQERHELDAQQQEVPLLCGGSDAIPRVADSLADSTRRLEDGLQRAFAPYAAGFTLEDLMHTADALQIDGTHDTMVWVEVGCSLSAPGS